MTGAKYSPMPVASHVCLIISIASVWNHICFCNEHVFLNGSSQQLDAASQFPFMELFCKCWHGMYRIPIPTTYSFILTALSPTPTPTMSLPGPWKVSVWHFRYFGWTVWRLSRRLHQRPVCDPIQSLWSHPSRCGRLLRDFITSGH